MSIQTKTIAVLVAMMIAGESEASSYRSLRRILDELRTPPGPSSTTHYLSRRRVLRDDFGLAHRGPQVEIVERAVSRKELLAIQMHNVLKRRGTPRATPPIYVTNRVPLFVRDAKRFLGLTKTPYAVVRLEVPKGVFGPTTIVKPLTRRFRPTLPGGGLERTTDGRRIVPVRIIEHQVMVK